MTERGRPERERQFRDAGQADDEDQALPRCPPSGNLWSLADMAGVNDVVQLAELPLLLTIRQAAKVLGVCPAKVYEMAHRFEATGDDGLPVIRLDKLYRVPRWAFAVLVLTGRVVNIVELEAHRQQVSEQLSDPPSSIPTPAVVPPEAGRGSRSSGRRAGGRLSPGRRRATAVEQLRLLPGE